MLQNTIEKNFREAFESLNISAKNWLDFVGFQAVCPIQIVF